MTDQFSCNVLVVDDDAAIRNMLTFLLEQEGFAVITASDGEDALEKLQDFSQPPCIILLDLNMPIMTGWEFRLEQKRRARLANIPVAIISADRSLEQQPFSVDAIGYFRKPIDIPALLELTHSCCTQS